MTLKGAWVTHLWHKIYGIYDKKNFCYRNFAPGCSPEKNSLREWWNTEFIAKKVKTTFEYIYSSILYGAYSEYVNMTTDLIAVSVLSLNASRLSSETCNWEHILLL